MEAGAPARRGVHCNSRIAQVFTAARLPRPMRITARRNQGRCDAFGTELACHFHHRVRWLSLNAGAALQIENCALRHCYAAKRYSRTSSKICQKAVDMGIEASPSFVREPEGNGLAERFIRKRAMANGVKFGRKPKLSEYQRKEAIKRRAAGETLAEIAKSYAVDISMISRLS